VAAAEAEGSGGGGEAGNFVSLITVQRETLNSLLYMKHLVSESIQ
jgi:hypothetical protein